MNTRTIAAQPLAAGWVEGTLCFIETPSDLTPATAYTTPEPTTEANRFQQQVTALGNELKAAMDELERDALSAEAAILRAHLSMLHDPQFQKRVQEVIHQSRLAAEAAVAHVLEEMISVFQQADDPILAERSRDLEDLAEQLRARLTQGDADPLVQRLQAVDRPVLAVSELLPSLVLTGRRHGVQGFIVERGTGMAHAAILARSFGLPILRVNEIESLRSYEGQRVRLDADQGQLLLAPSQQTANTSDTFSAQVTEPTTSADRPARLWLSIVDPAQLDGIDWRGTQGVGLYRTEVLFMEQRALPDEQQQMNVYARAFAAAGDRDRPVTVRTLDIGGDKELDYFSLGPQVNPYLGLRAHRLYRYHPELLTTQLRAILRAAKGHTLRLLFPMIEHREAWDEVQQLVAQAVASLRNEGVSFQDDFQQGVLLETPSAVWDLPRLLQVVDFVSVGTNDLVQYLFAVERGNPNVGQLYQPEHPVMLGVLRQVVEQTRRAGKDVSICGEIAGDPAYTALLIGLGYEDLSVAPAARPAVTGQLVTIDPAEAAALAKRCLEADSAEAVQAALGLTPGGVGNTSDDEAVDPVCGMRVHVEENPLVVEFRHRRFYFCSVGCLNQFWSGLK